MSMANSLVSRIFPEIPCPDPHHNILKINLSKVDIFFPSPKKKF